MAANVADQLIKDGKVHQARIGIKLGLLTPVLPSSSASSPAPRECWSTTSSRAARPTRRASSRAT